MNKEQYQRRYFEQHEAEAKVGQRVRSLVEFSRVAQGTIGRVVEADPTGSDAEYTVAIQWALPQREPVAQLLLGLDEAPVIYLRSGKPLVDWFSLDEYEQFLEEIGDDDETPPTLPEPVV